MSFRDVRRWLRPATFLVMPQVAHALENHWTERRYQRHKVEAKLRMHVFVGEDCTMLVHGQCRELGRGGLGAVLSTQLRPGESVWIQLSLNFGAYAAVRYSKGFYHGFEFTMLRSNDRTRLEAICDSYGAETGARHTEPFSCGTA